MTTREIIALDTTTPQLRAPGTGDTYLAPRTIGITPEVGTAHAVLNGTTSGAISLKAQAAAGTYSLTFANALPGSTAFFKSDASGNISFDTSTYITGNQTVTLSGDISGSGATAITTTLATVNGNVGTFALSTTTVNAKGLVTAVSAASTTGSGNVVLATSPNLTTPILGTPTSGNLANCTGYPSQVAGSSLTLQYNNAGAFAGMSGTSWDDTNRSLTLTGATVTTSKPILNLSQTWNGAGVTFSGVVINITETANASFSNAFVVQKAGVASFTVFSGAAGSQAVGTMYANNFYGGGTNGVGPNIIVGATTITQGTGGALLWQSTARADQGSLDLAIYRDAAANLALRNTTNAQTFRVYNTYTDASNYERGVFDWGTTANTLTVGTQKAGTGSSRNIALVSGGTVLLTSGTGIGYGVGTGGAVTQATSRTTGVTLNFPTGAITLVSAAGTTSWQSFTLTNSAIAATDIVKVSQKSGTDLYQIHVTATAAGSCQITFATTGGTTTEQPVFNFYVAKGSAS